MRCRLDKVGILPYSWDVLCRRASPWSVFMTWPWQSSWWEHLGEGRKLAVAPLSGDGDRLVGILPLYETEDKTYRFTGSSELSDYLDFLIYKEHEDSAYGRLEEKLTEILDQGGSLDLHCIPERSSTIPRLMGFSEKRGCRLHLEKEKACPAVELPDTWDGYLEGLGRKDRQELRRKMRKAEGLDLRVVRESDRLDESLEAFFELMAKSLKDKAEFIRDERKRGFLRAVSRELHAAKLAELSFLCHEGKRIAATLSFRNSDGWGLYNSGFDPEYSELSPGIVLIGRAIQAAIERGDKRYDLMRGDEAYKYHFGARDAWIHRIVMSG